MGVPNLRSASGCLIAGALALLLSSCGRTDSPRPYPCKGSVRINGEPAKDAMVAFYHLDEWGKRTIVPMAWTDDHGDFVLTTYKEGDGAPAGDYEVTITWPAYHTRRGVGPDRLDGRFADPKKSGLHAHVEAKDNELEPFTIKADVEPVDPEAATRQPNSRKRN